MLLKIKLVHLSILFTLFLGITFAAPLQAVAITTELNSTERSALTLDDGGAHTLGDCSGEVGTCT